MPIFIDYDFPRPERVDSESGGRKYVTPEGKSYPSASSITGLINEGSIDGWRNKVGHAVADKISSKAATRGTLIHEACENYLKATPTKFSMFQQTESQMFGYLLPILDKIQEVHAMETLLYSNNLRVAGTVDLIAKIDNAFYVIDWKTSGRVKHKKDIPNYFCQAAAYAYMFWERTGVVIKDIKIVMTVEDHGLLVFDEKVQDWLPMFIEYREKFKKKEGW